MKSINEQKLLKYLGLEIQKNRLKLNLSQEQLGHKSGIDRSYISDVELGKRNISITKVFELCLILHISPSELIKAFEGDLISIKRI